MRMATYLTFLIMVVVLWPARSAMAAGKAGYYLVSQPEPMGGGVPLGRYRHSSRHYASYLWKLTPTTKGYHLKKEARIPTGGGFRQFAFWPSESLLVVSGWPNGYGTGQKLCVGKWTHGMLVKLIDLASPQSSACLWVPEHWLRLLQPAGGVGRTPLLLVAGAHNAVTFNLGSGRIRQTRSFHVRWKRLYLRGGPSDVDTDISLFAKIRTSGEVWISPTTPPGLSQGDIKYFIKTPWKIPKSILKQTDGSDPEYTLMMVNTPSLLVIGRTNIGSVTSKICLFIFSKLRKMWSIHWIDSGLSFYPWAFGPWITSRIFAPDNGTVGAATGTYWFYNSATGQSWQQKLGDQHTWLLYMSNRYALVRRENNLYRFTVGKNKLWRRKLLISDPRIRNVYWACPIPKPQPSGKQNHPQFFWKKPGFKLPKALQPPLGVAGSPTTAPTK